MTKSSLLLPGFMGASLMFGTTYLLKYGINILQDPLSNALVSITTLVNTDEYLNLLLPSVSYGLFCNLKKFLTDYYSTNSSNNVIEEKTSNDTVNVVEDQAVASNDAPESIQSNVQTNQLMITNTPSIDGISTSSDEVAQDIDSGKGKMKAIENITSEKTSDEVVTTITKPSTVTPTSSESNSVAATNISRSSRTSNGGVLPYNKDNIETNTVNDVVTSFATPIRTSNAAPFFNRYMQPLSFHSSAATSSGINPDGSKLELPQPVADRDLFLATKLNFMYNRFSVKSGELIVAENRAANLQVAIMKEAEKYDELESKHNLLLDNFKKQSEMLNSNLLLKLSQFQYTTFSSFIAKMGMFFSTTIDIVHNTSLHTMTGLGIYALAQFTTNFYTRKLAAGIVSTLYGTVFNRITKICCTFFVKNFIRVGIFGTLAVSIVFAGISYAISTYTGIGGTTFLGAVLEWYASLNKLLFKVVTYISGFKPIIKHIIMNKGLFFINLFGDIHKLILYPSIVFECILTKFNLSTLLDYLKFNTGYVYYPMRAYYSLQIWSFILDVITLQQLIIASIYS